MERIKLANKEKEVFRMICGSIDECPPTFPEYKFNGAVKTLERNGLVKAAYLEGGAVDSVRVTSWGLQYMAKNPHLSNPINWAKLSAIASCIAAVAALLALFISCSPTIRIFI